MSFESPRSRGSGCGIALSYALSAVTGCVGVAVWLSARSLILAILKHTRISVWSWGAVDKFGFLLLGLGWLISVFLSQNYYERGFEKDLLWPRFLRVSLIEVLVLGLIVGGTLLLA